MAISVEKKENNGGTFWDITVDGITIYGCKRVQANGKDFMSPPQRKYKDRDGNDKWIGIVRFDREIGAEILQAVKEYEEGSDLGDSDSTGLEPF